MTESVNEGAARAAGIGTRLKAARERAGLSLLKAADKMHVDPSVIQALESENFAQLGPLVYIRGHLRRYAELVKESPPQLLDLYAASMNAGTSPDLTLMPHARNNSSMRGALLMTGAALLIGVGLIGSVRWIYLDLHPATAVSPLAVQPPAASAPPVIAAPPAVNSAAAAPSLPIRMAAVPLSSAPKAPASPTKGPRSRTPAVADTSVTLKFKADCWTEVYDARGGQLYRAIGAEGAEATLRGIGPLKVVIGNAAAVSVETNEKVRAIPQAAQSGHRAQFLVTREGALQPLLPAPAPASTPGSRQRVTTAGNKP